MAIRNNVKAFLFSLFFCNFTSSAWVDPIFSRIHRSIAFKWYFQMPGYGGQLINLEKWSAVISHYHGLN